MANPNPKLDNLKPLVKGFDPRRNLKGVPRDAIALRKHMRKIAAEIIGGDESAMTRMDAMLRQLWTSRNPAHNKLALQVLDPKILTERVDVTNSDGSLKPDTQEVYDSIIRKLGLTTAAAEIGEVSPIKPE